MTGISQRNKAEWYRTTASSDLCNVCTGHVYLHTSCAHTTHSPYATDTPTHKHTPKKGTFKTKQTVLQWKPESRNRMKEMSFTVNKNVGTINSVPSLKRNGGEDSRHIHLITDEMKMKNNKATCLYIPFSRWKNSDGIMFMCMSSVIVSF